MPTPKPYLTTTPWQLFTLKERKRPVPLKHCPSKKCQRAKSCIDAHELTYCQRTHESVAERRARLKLIPAPAIPLKPWSYDEVQAKAEQSDNDLANAQAKERELTKRWKAGEFDHLYGKFKPHGVLKQPPPREFVG